MSTGGCSRFKQNAWKKELCSNCYRPKEEHKQKVEKPIQKLYLPLKAASQGILNVGNKKQRKKKAVRFTKEESEVIGYGGVESDSDEEEELEFERSEEPVFEREVIGEEEKALERLTKSNTDFNSVLGNLNGTKEPLVLLGTQPKQKVKISIQPFSSSSIAASRKSHLNKLLEDEVPKPVVLDSSLKENDKRDIMKEETSMPKIKTIVIEGKKEERGNPEGRKTQITRGSIITKTHEQVKNKLYIQNVQKSEKRNSLQDKTNEEGDIKTIIITGPNIEEKNAKNLQESRIEQEQKVEPTKVKVESEEVTVKVLKLLNGHNGPPESREMAGEPDGKADSDEPETPITPPPRSSFLHREVSVSPHVTPVTSPATTPTQVTPTEVKPLIVKPEVPPPTIPLTPPLPATPPPQTTLPALIPLQIPLPSPPLQSPVTTPIDDPPVPLLQEVVRCKRPAPKPPITDTPPEPLPRRRGSLEVHSNGTEKKKTRVRQTLKKLLRFGSREDDSTKNEDEYSTPPRPRPQIIHPLDLNKSGVQVLPPHSSSSEKSSPDYGSTSSISHITSRPTKPPPPPRSESLNLLERLRPSPSSDNVYANLGEGRCGITPVKPQRTGSMRDTAKSNSTSDENVYEIVGVNSSPVTENKSMTFFNNSDNESDIYYPYVSFQKGEMKSTLKRKERGTVHSTLEENYGAVVIANLEALNNLLQQVKNKKPDIPPGLINCDSFSLNSFQIQEDKLVEIDSFTFIDAKYNDEEITLSLTISDLEIPNVLFPISKFKDTVPTSLAKGEVPIGNFTVLRRLKIDKLMNYGKQLEKSPESVREGVLVLLQVVKFLNNGKSLASTDNFIVFSTAMEPTPKPCYIPCKGEEMISSEELVSDYINELLGDLPLRKVLSKCNLADMQEVLQVWLWGPTTMLPTTTLKRWLDLERANVLQSLVCAQPSVPQREHLDFLVYTNARAIAKASTIIHTT